MASTKHGMLAPGIFVVANTTDRDALGTDDKVVAGTSLVLVLGDGLYRCDTAAAASSTWSGRLSGNLTLDSASPVLTVGDGNGSPALILDKDATAGVGYVQFGVDAAAKRIAHMADESLAFQHWTGTWNTVMDIVPTLVSVKQNLETLGTVFVGANISLSSASPQIYIGNGAGGPNIALDRDGASGSQIAFIHDGAAASTDKRIRHETGGLFSVDNYNGASYDILQSWSASLSTFYTSLSLSSASPTLTVGDLTGAPLILVQGNTTTAIRVRAPNGAQAQYWLYSDANARWQMVKVATSDDWNLQRYTGASVFQDTPLTVQSSDGGVIVGASSGLVSFYGGTPTTKQSITGSKGGNAALGNLLTALVNLNLIADATT